VPSHFSNWDDVRILLVAARTGTVTAAAKQLGMDPTTVTRRLRALETSAGVRLIDKIRGGIQLSAKGEQLLQTAQRLEDEFAATARVFDGGAYNVQGVVRVAVQEMFAMAWVKPLAAIAAQHPGLEVHLVESDEPASLTRRDADVALRISSNPPEHLVGRRVGKITAGAYGAASLAPFPK